MLQHFDLEICQFLHAINQLAHVLFKFKRNIDDEVAFLESPLPEDESDAGQSAGT